MPAWWSKKPSSSTKTPLEQHLADRLAIAEASWKPKGKAKSFDDVFGRRPKSRPSPSSSSLPSTDFDFDGGVQKRGHPLPRPSDLTAASSLPLLDQTTPGSASVSSVSSSGSSDETPDLGCRYAETVRTSRARSEKVDSSSQQQHLTENLQFHTSYSSHPRQDLSTSPRGELLSNGYISRGETSETKCSSRTRSPGPTSTSHSPLSSSPLHPRLSGFHPNSSSDKQEEVKILCHPLPLPPSSPTSPSHAFRSSGSNENCQSLRSKWKKGKLLGRGTFGHVYLGFSSENGNMCAIKEVRVVSDDQNSRESLKQLNQEISLLSQLSHPNIVQYYGSELAEESLSVYLEYVSGGSIHKLLKEYGPFKEPVIRSYARQILSGLAYLHERNTVHRDIKGANILVDPNGEIKLADFGMAKHINSCTNVLSFKGSPYWMAPEVIMNANGYNLAVDIWSLGCTILEMATSKAPWSQYEGVAAIFKIGNSKDIPDIPEHISDDGKNFLTLCLRRHPSDRPTAAQLLEHPFVRDYIATRVARTTVSKHLHPSGDRSVFLHREISRSQEPDSDIKHKAAYPTGLNQFRDNTHPRVNMSLPVSPCSSPLRQFGAGAYGNYFLSPPHPMTKGFGFDTYPIYPPRGTIGQARRSIETSSDIHLFKQQTPGGSPRAID